MNCKKCGDTIPNRVYIDGRSHNLSKRKYCLVCSPLGQRQFNKPETEGKVCSRCHNYKLAIEFYIRSEKGKLTSMCRLCFKLHDGKRALKEECVNYKGGECIRCGYSKCLAAFDFHHRDPQEKDVKISDFRKRKFTDEIKLELDKCDLLCANCHREIHDELSNPLDNDSCQGR